MPSRRFFLVCLLFCALIAIFGNAQISRAAEVILEWNANTEPDLAGYKVHYGTRSRSYTTSINAAKVTGHTVTGLQAGSTYYFAVTAYDSRGMESGYSNEVSAAITSSCNYAISPTSQSFGSVGGSATVSVTAPQGCAWTASTGVPWVTITSGKSGSGNGSVGLSVAPNTAGSRAAGITIADKTFTVTQSAGSCTYSISPTSQSFSASGGSALVSVTAAQGCAWTASSGLSWVTITSGSSGSGNGTVSVSVASNTGASRSGGITIAGKTFTVSQAAASQTSYTITASAGTGGSISPSGAVSVKAGASQTFSIKPKFLYRISSVTVDGKSVGAVSSYTFANVNGNHTIQATFRRKW